MKIREIQCKKLESVRYLLKRLPYNRYHVARIARKGVGVLVDVVRPRSFIADTCEVDVKEIRFDILWHLGLKIGKLGF